MSGESKDLWVFYFTTLPDLSGQLAPELKGIEHKNRINLLVMSRVSLSLLYTHTYTEEATGSWEDGMSTESSGMLFRALNSLIERLISNTMIKAHQARL